MEVDYENVHFAGSYIDDVPRLFRVLFSHAENESGILPKVGRLD